MPHECTTCGRTFPDGSKEMLSGCPDCGGNKFQFAPAGRASTGSSNAAQSTAAETTAESRPDATGTAGSAESTGTVERAAETVRDWVSSGSARPADSADASQEPAADANRDPTTATNGDPTADANRNPAADANRDSSTSAWPSSDERPDSDASAETGEFTEWPETARRPEDRSTPPSDDARGTSQTASASEPTPDRSAAVDDGSIMADDENTAQADARSEVVSSDDLPAGSDRSDRGMGGGSSRTDAPVHETGDRPPEHGRVVSEPSGEQPSIEELRAELNEQFESIKIVSPGQYELNLMELYNREEYIISLQEDGRYVIDVPDSWRADEE
ncbi:OapC/ArvC family zinc-ribbon domain-containing protein [Haloterrigena alkaliphila]|uniref:Zn-ribbon containing protein n=1 Tax=Haloterrigena alkaliphila TaxID=2816475 RepID=A0A8A2VJ15_9EURY|nr:Zn-ribbon containing protein [Haloterrigena alkaliphila]QSX00628.1 hypothetical protein J0X25_06625 [Haloterrigena alkaliphila]